MAAPKESARKPPDPKETEPSQRCLTRFPPAQQAEKEAPRQLHTAPAAADATVPELSRTNAPGKKADTAGHRGSTRSRKVHVRPDHSVFRRLRRFLPNPAKRLVQIPAPRPEKVKRFCDAESYSHRSSLQKPAT